MRWLESELPWVWVVLLHLVEFAVMVRAVVRPQREPASRIAWVAVILAVPLLGSIAYVLFGEVRLGRIARKKGWLAADEDGEARRAEVDRLAAGPLAPYGAPFLAGHRVNGFGVARGNRGELLPPWDGPMDRLVRDIDAAERHVHLSYYIWLDDEAGGAVAEAVTRAARRDVTCRVMVDGLGSRAFVRSEHWAGMGEAGASVAIALPLRLTPWRLWTRRLDLRDHRKIVVIDGRIAHCGSQNCAHPSFAPKAKYAPWIDIVLRMEGPIVAQNQRLFCDDWHSVTGERVTDVYAGAEGADGPAYAQVIATGPNNDYGAMSEVFQTLAYAARETLTISTPYYVPNEALHTSLCAAARRGVDVRIVFPERNDSAFVAWSSRSYYPEFLDAGVRVFEYPGGVLHAKTLTVDGRVTLIGSANMDRRSLDLNFENNVLIHDEGLARQVRGRQADYLSASREVTAEEVAGWSLPRRLRNDAMAMLGPVL